MILEPSVDNLLTKINSKYALVIISAKRARDLQDSGGGAMVESPKSTKNVGVALEEIMDEKLTIDEEVL
ncbi:DNA-directed RNA polymerase subunit omega [Tenuibacillus multivorans]|uniref:DNA-directed RNA polymerase subunit omega n=1 Tax=Tenuibacillus multivorans TaxID=237069 RepID=A0A1G9Y319_9BACI|nr:DNA-directed RNA polymerase subunit omega [Tenuibacillus multivorans]GEL75930.1 DNA-directed RNA polymerase subunit omega [Tenuibacillus multivorans]SDN03504.1 DNA-directed RNA polymerase subunit omega [Tenuibacillus multivorans]